jgi:hypothetical protein
MLRGTEIELGRTGREGDEHIQSLVRTARLIRGEDLPLPEIQAGTRLFDSETRDRLLDSGHINYVLTGKSLAALRQDGRRFRSNWHEQYPKFETLRSDLVEVAFRREPLFLDKSDKNQWGQESVVARYNYQLQDGIPGARAILAEAPDYEELAFAHLDATTEAGNPDFLFGPNDEYYYTATRTRVGENVALVGPLPSWLWLARRQSASRAQFSGCSRSSPGSAGPNN